MRRHTLLPLLGLGLGLLTTGACTPTTTTPGGIEVSGTVAEEFPAVVRAALEEAETLELLSLHPYPRGAYENEWEEKGLVELEVLDEYAVLGKTPLAGDDRRRVVQALYDGVTASDGMVAACFNPRHGLSATHGGKKVDVVICYECLSMQFHVDGEHAGNALTTEAPGRLFTDVLRAAKVPLPDK